MKSYIECDFIILLLHIDDMLPGGNDIKRIAPLNKALSKSLGIKDLGPDEQILGMKISRDRYESCFASYMKDKMSSSLKGSICKA
jgi:hypothetical protein